LIDEDRSRFLSPLRGASWLSVNGQQLAVYSAIYILGYHSRPLAFLPVVDEKQNEQTGDVNDAAAALVLVVREDVLRQDHQKHQTCGDEALGAARMSQRSVCKTLSLSARQYIPKK
jgi:hypothetical protein